MGEKRVARILKKSTTENYADIAGYAVAKLILRPGVGRNIVIKIKKLGHKLLPVSGR